MVSPANTGVAAMDTGDPSDAQLRDMSEVGDGAARVAHTVGAGMKTFYCLREI